MVQYWVKSSQVFRIFGLKFLVLLILLALSLGGPVRVLALEETYRASLKRKVDAFFGEGEFEKFVQKYQIFRHTENEGLEAIASCLERHLTDEAEIAAWEAGQAEPPYWWYPGCRYAWWPPSNPTHPTCGLEGHYIYDEDSIEFQEQASVFLQKLQEAVRTHNKEAFSELFVFPTYWYVTRHDFICLKSREDVISNFDRILCPEMRRVLLNLKLEDVEILKKNFFTYILVDSGVFWLQCDWKIYKALPPKALWGPPEG